VAFETTGRYHNFSAIFIIQCLESRDTNRTGVHLYERIKPLCDKEAVYLRFFDVDSAQSIIDTLREIARDCEANERAPIVHLETHATATGFGPTDGDQLPWGALIEPLTELNRISQMNLLLTVAACHGFHVVSTLRPGVASPVWGLLGPDEQVMPSDIARGFQAFYAALLTELSVNRAIEALKENDHSWPECWKFQNAELWFAGVFGEVLRQHLELGERGRLETVAIAEWSRHGVNIDPQRFRAGRVAGRDWQGAYDATRSKFLMLDSYPENADRFPLTVQEIAAIKGLDLV